MAKWQIDKASKSATLDILGGVLKIERIGADGLKVAWQAVFPAEDGGKPRTINTGISIPRDKRTVVGAMQFAPHRLLESLRRTHPELLFGEPVEDGADPF